MKTSIVYSVVLLMFFTLQGCAKFNPAELSALEQRELDSLEAAGVECPDVVSATAATSLNILFPAGGDLYLGTGDHAEESVWPDAGVVDLLIWPAGAVLSAPRAYLIAESINDRKCIQVHRSRVKDPIRKGDSSIVVDSHGNKWGSFHAKDAKKKTAPKYNMIVVGSPEYHERYR